MKLSQNQLDEILQRKPVAARNPELTGLPTDHTRPRPVAELEPAFINVALGSASVQAPGRPSFRVSVCSIRTRLLDEDNLSEKYLVDQLRYFGLIPDDNPAQTTICSTQRKCGKGEPEHVEITIDRL